MIMEIQDIIVFCMELMGTVAFAASGAMTGINCRMDAFGVCVLGAVTAVGGGMTRDVVLGNVPGALTRPVYVLAAVVTAAVVFAVLYFNKNLLQGNIGMVYDRIMLIMDSTGLGIFTVMGVMTGINEGYAENTFLLTVLGTLTGAGGGLLRDMMAGQAAIHICEAHLCLCIGGRGCKLRVHIQNIRADSGYGYGIRAGNRNPSSCSVQPLESAAGNIG